MPVKKNRLCVDCTGVAINGTRYCQRHQTRNNASEYERLSEQYRADDEMKKLRNRARWTGAYGTRKRVLLRDPLCKMCGHAASTICDHIVPARQVVAEFGVDEFYNVERCQGLCKPCHDYKTATEDSTFAKQGAKRS